MVCTLMQSYNNHAQFKPLIAKLIGPLHPVLTNPSLSLKNQKQAHSGRAVRHSDQYDLLISMLFLLWTLSRLDHLFEKTLVCVSILPGETMDGMLLLTGILTTLVS